MCILMSYSRTISWKNRKNYRNLIAVLVSCFKRVARIGSIYIYIYIYMEGWGGITILILLYVCLGLGIGIVSFIHD